MNANQAKKITEGALEKKYTNVSNLCNDVYQKIAETAANGVSSLKYQNLDIKDEIEMLLIMEKLSDLGYEVTFDYNDFTLTIVWYAFKSNEYIIDNDYISIPVKPPFKSSNLFPL